MATPITAKTFKMIAGDALDAVFREAYGEKTFENEYMMEVNFEETAIRVSDIRDDDGA